MSANASATATRKRTPLPMAPHKPEPYAGPSKAEVIAMRKQYLSPGLMTYYQEPLLLAVFNATVEVSP